MKKDAVSTEERDLPYLLLQIKNKYSSFSFTLKKVADYILHNYHEAPYLNISKMAAKCAVSEASITKFVKALGYRGFSEFKISLARNADNASGEPSVYGEITLGDPIDELCEKVFRNNVDTLMNTLRILDKQALEETASLMVKAKRIDFYGQGGSSIPALNATIRLQRLGIRASYFLDPHQQVTSASLLEKGDVAVGISNSGRTHDIIASLGMARQSGAATVCITSNDNSPIIRQADIVLLTSTSNSEIIDDIISSRIAELSLLDALYLCIAGKIKKRALQNLYTTSDALRTKKYIK